MCLILFAYRYHPRYELVLAANRDEFFDRATAPAAFWDDQPDILAGRDLEAGGTWLGITCGGRFAAITNFRDPSSVIPDAPSRGALVSDFLRGHETADGYLQRLAPNASAYNGFNLLAWDGERLCYFSNRNGAPRALPAGLYGLSNELLDTPWPKVRRGRDKLAAALLDVDAADAGALLALLDDRAPAPDEDLPNTGVGLELERELSPLFISMPHYGTRSSTALLVDYDRTIELAEKTRDDGVVRRFRFSMFG
jgi:uncharacterized protein with NRDE domain